MGCGVAIARRLPEKKKIENYKALMVLENIDPAAERITIHPVDE